MRSHLLLLLLGVFSGASSFSQIKKQFSIEESTRFDKVDFTFSCKSGVCYIRPGYKPNPLSIYSNQDINEYSHSFKKDIDNRTCSVKLDLENKEANDFSRTISYKVFNSESKPASKLWKVYLSKNNPYRLDLRYGMGDANIDLSGLSIENFKVISGNADVTVGYMSGLGNQVEMDTFYVKVDLGSVQVKKMNLCKSKQVIADVGFGNLALDFSNKPETKSNISASVGAGSLLILLPDDDVPAIVKINNSLLCRVRLSESFKEIENNVFVNEHYKEDAENLLSFNLDVSLGNITFKEK